MKVRYFLRRTSAGAAIGIGLLSTSAATAQPVLPSTSTPYAVPVAQPVPQGSYPSSSYAPAPYGAAPAYSVPAEVISDVIIDPSMFAGEDDIETVVVKDPAKLPPPLKEHLDQLPEAERERVFKVIRESGVKVPTAMASGAAGESTDDPAQLKAMQLLSQFTEMKQLMRTTSTILAARSEQLKLQADDKDPKVKKPISLAELLGGGSSDEFGLLQTRLLAGDWIAVREQLAALPADAATNVYGHILMLLSQGGGTLAPLDVLAVADAAPKKLARHQLDMLGRMLSASPATVERPDRLLAELEKGNRRLGGKDRELRLAAARLLFEAGLTEEAGKFLVPLDTAMKENDAVQLNLYAALLVAKSRDPKTPEALVGAWDLFQHVLSTADRESSGYGEALQQTCMLLGRVPRHVGTPWLQDAFENQPSLGLMILSQLTTPFGYANDNQPARLPALKSLKTAIDELTPAAKKMPERWTSPLQLLVSEWSREIDRSNGGNQQDVDIDTNDEMYSGGRMYPNHGDYSQTVDHGAILATAPDEACLACIDPETAWMVRLTAGRLAARAAAKDECYAAVKRFAKHDSEAARRIAESYLISWAQKLNPNQQNHNEYEYMNYSGSPYAYSRTMSYGRGGAYYSYSNYNSGSMVPLTRARQVRNLAALRTTLDEIHALGVEQLDGPTVVAIFTACHSPAEVYLRDDVVNVFGDFDRMDDQVVLALASALRQNLAGQWRQIDLQEQHGTQRTDAELAAEINRGYALAGELLQAASDDEPPGPGRLLLTGNVQFDHAEFMYGQKVDLKTYVAARDEAFASYRRAHESYAAGLGATPTEKYTPEVYVQWFQSALGASDLAYLSRQDEPDLDQIDQVAAAIKSLGKQESQQHLELFGKLLSEQLSNVPAHLKPWMVRESLRILGDEPSAKPMRDLLSLYDDLQSEIALHLRVDGSSDVGRKPFGVHVVLRGTTAVMREGQGFAALLQPQGYSAATSEPVNHKERIEKEVREKLGEGFEIVQIRFHEPTVEPRTFGRDGWRELPLAYLVLRAKDDAVDRIPSIDLDLEYSDGKGFVVLPIHSAVELVDARSAPPPRPLAEVKIKQVLDDRKLDKNQIRLELSAAGKGLIPELTDLLGPIDAAAANPDLTIVETVDHGVTIGALDTKSDDIRPECERRWTIDLAARPDRRPSEFRFPTAKVPQAVTEVTYARYDDADLATAAPVVSLRSWPLGSRLRKWSVAGVAALALIVMGIYLVRRRMRHAQVTTIERYRRPEQVTPFSVIALLKKMVGDSASTLSSADRADLAEAIRHLEDRYFARSTVAPATANGHADLETLLATWLGKFAPAAARGNAGITPR